MVNILVIPDAHNRPSISPQRFDWVANLIDSRKPDVVVCLGDFFDMESLSSYDKGRKNYEGRRYIKDITSGKLGLMLLDTMKHKPRRVFCIGNHEQRIERAVEAEPMLEGKLSYDDLGLKQRGWEVVPFLKPARIAGINFVHYAISGLMGRPISGENPATTLLNKCHQSTVVGHSHLLDFSERTNMDGKKIQAVAAGCFLAEGQYESYAGPANNMWHNGLLYLHDCKDGQFDLETISLKRLKKEYQ